MEYMELYKQFLCEYGSVQSKTGKCVSILQKNSSAADEISMTLYSLKPRSRIV